MNDSKGLMATIAQWQRKCERHVDQNGEVDRKITEREREKGRKRGIEREEEE